MDNREIAKDMTVALIHEMTFKPKEGDDQVASKWVAQSYKIIHNAVANPQLDEE